MYPAPEGRHNIAQDVGSWVGSGEEEPVPEGRQKRRGRMAQLSISLAATNIERKEPGNVPSPRFLRKNSWCQRRDLNSQTPVSKTTRYANSRTLALVHRGGFEPPRPHSGKPGYSRSVSSRAQLHLGNLAEGRRIYAHRSLRCPGFQDQLPAIQQYLPHGGECGELNPLASFGEPGLNKDA